MGSPGLVQHGMIERVREACHADERVVAALLFGSFAIGEGDGFSDIEFAVFIRDEWFDGFDQRAWIDAANPVAAYFPDEFGHHTALFRNAVRGEFHVMRASDLPVVAGWQGQGWFPSLDAAVLLDRSGELTRHASLLVGGPPVRGGSPLVESLALNLVNLMLLAANLLLRGEQARAWALLGRAHEPLLKLVRLQAGVTGHWPTPSRALETDLLAAVYERYLTCTAGAEPVALRMAYRESWRWSCELFDAVARPLGIGLPAAVIGEVERRLDEALGRHAEGDREGAHS